MNIILSLAAVVPICVALYKFYKIKVPDGFETPSTFKIVLIYFLCISKISNVCDKLGISKHPTAFRFFFKFLGSKTVRKNPDGIKVRDAQMNDVWVRVYTPMVDHNKKLPLMIWYHGGAYIFGSVDVYDSLTYEFAEKLGIMVISVEYKLAPENSYPIPLEDCWKATNAILDSHEELNFDLNKLILAGDSAGGAITCVITKRLREKNALLPSMQVMVYPWLQHINYFLPSHDYFRKNPSFDTIGASGIQLVLWYLGETGKHPDFEAELKNGRHLLLVDDKQVRAKLLSYMDPMLVPDKYKVGKVCYGDKHDSPFDSSFVNSELDETSILKTNLKLKKLAEKLLNSDVSPGLIDDEKLRIMPKTYFVVCEMDSLKDEAIILSERLRKAGVAVEVAYYETGYHGMINAIQKNIYFNRISSAMVDDIVRYINRNLENL